jgi:hypothetical protein
MDDGRGDHGRLGMLLLGARVNNQDTSLPSPQQLLTAPNK